MDFSLIVMPIYTSVLVAGILYAATRKKYSSIALMIFGSSAAVPIFLLEFEPVADMAFGFWFGAWIITYIYILKRHRGILEKLDAEFGKKKSKK